jgi:hypothetical protein
VKRIVSAALGFVMAVPLMAFVQSRTGGNGKHWELTTINTSVHTNVVDRNTHAIRYFLASDGYSTNAAAELNALRATFAQWQAVSGTRLKFEDAGTVAPGVDVNTSDNRNVLYWAKSSTVVNGGLSDISGALGVTFTSTFADGTIKEADIVFNGVEYAWFTDYSNTNSTAQFVESTATHEIGHFIGLDHSPVGAASMLYVGGDGVDLQSGLSSDEISGARSIYGTNQFTALAALKGQVTKNGSGILGGAVFVEDSATNIIAGTVTRSGGNYEMPALPSGKYQVRVAPLDDAAASDWLVRGADISSEYNAADTGFLPTSTTSVTLSVGITNTVDFAVVNGAPAFHITSIRSATTSSGMYSWSALPTSVRVGQSNIYLGVVSADLPTSGAALTITGDGLAQGPVTFNPNLGGTGLNFISTKISVATNATPGMRSFVVQQGANVAYANGFLEILPAHPDVNFDGLDDLFQRKYFPLFTAANAAPNADPDGDGFSNTAEYIAGTNPTNAASLVKIDAVTNNVSGTSVVWRSILGKSYQLQSRTQLGSGTNWTSVGSPVVASGATTFKLDLTGTNGNRFYRVQVLP